MIDSSDSNDATTFRSKGMYIQVDQLCYSIQPSRNPASKKVILKNLSFQLAPGSLCALLGPSGSGKSTLLDLLSDRKLEGEWSGNILFNGGPRSKWFRRDSAYILQDDLHIPTLTVRETIQFAANTRLPEGTSKEAIEERIVSLLDILGLDHIQNSVVGDTDSRGISGGQLKRLSIAVEIVSLPDVIFLDEPTSGLDSLIALEVMQAVRKLANQNRTVVSTIHQPSPLVFDLFDTVMLIAEGRMVYHGPVQQVVPFFTSLGYSYDLGENPAEFIIEISQNAKLSSLHGRMSVLELERKFLSSELAANVNTQKLITGAASPDQDNKSKRLHATSKYTQFKMLVHRDLLSISRDTHAIVALVSKNVIVGLLIGIVFFQQVKVTTPLFNAYGVPEPEVTNISALIFFGMMHTMVSNAEAIPHLVTKSLVFRREINAFAYSVSPYWLSHCLTVIPLLLVGFVAFAASTYFLVSFPLDSAYMFYFFTIMLLASLSSYYLAMAIAAYTNDQKLSLTIFPLCFLFLSTFAGYAIPVTDVSVVWKWATYVSYVRWAFQGLMNNQWGKYNSPEDNDGYHTVLEYYGFDNYNMYNSYWIMCLTIGLMVSLAYVAMRPQRSYLKKVTREQALNIGMQEELINPIYNTRLTESLTTAILSEGDDGVGVGKVSKDIEEGAVDDLSNADIDVSIPSSVGVNISFKDIFYTVHNIPVLHGVYGYIKGGEMCALMGSSGAGKSTLLDILANRKTMGSIEGTIYVNQFQLYHKEADDIVAGGSEGNEGSAGNALLTRLAGSRPSKAKYSSRVDIRKISAYVMQDNILYDTLTVYESLHYAALLRLPVTMSSSEKDERIRSIMRILGLSHISRSMIGNEAKRGISGGQKKRVSIGVEIIHLPDVIYLDEPTTGLDSLIAHEVISSIYRLTRFNRTVLCTIHQPSYKTFKLFHTVLLLSAGRVIYFGSTDKIKNYFTSMCATKYKYDDNFNPADFIIAVASNPATYAVDSTCTVSVETLSEQYRSSELGQDCVSTLQELIQINSHKASGGVRGIATDDMYNSSLAYQVQVLIRRLALRKWRGRHVIMATSCRHALIGLFYGTVYYQQPNGTDTSAYNNRLSMLFFSLLFVLMSHQEDIANIIEDRAFFYRERSVYSPFAYWLANLLVQIPFNVFNVTVYSSLVYFMVGFRPEVMHFLFFWYIMLMTDVIGMMVCQVVSNCSANAHVAMSLFPVSLFFSTAFEGFIVFIPSFPPWLGWLSYASYMRYSFQALALNELGHNSKLPLAGTYIEQLGFDSLSKWQCADVLWIFVAAALISGYCVLRFVNFEKR